MPSLLLIQKQRTLRGGRHGDEIRHGIELDKGHLSVVSLELQDGLRNRLRQTSLGELPELRVTESGGSDHHSQVGGRADDLLVVEGVEIEIADIAPANHDAKRYRTCVRPARAAVKASSQDCGAFGCKSDHRRLQQGTRSTLSCLLYSSGLRSWWRRGIPDISLLLQIKTWLVKARFNPGQYTCLYFETGW